jgi:hypothetical protein
MQTLYRLAGAVLGALAGYLLPSLLIRNPQEHDFMALMGWRIILVPVGALVGLFVARVLVPADPGELDLPR